MAFCRWDLTVLHAPYGILIQQLALELWEVLKSLKILFIWNSMEICYRSWQIQENGSYNKLHSQLCPISSNTYSSHNLMQVIAMMICILSLTHHGTEQKLYDHHSAGPITSRTSKFYLCVTGGTGSRQFTLLCLSL